MYSSASCLEQRKVDKYNQLKFKEIHINLILATIQFKQSLNIGIDKTCLKVLKKIKNGLKSERL